MIVLQTAFFWEKNFSIRLAICPRYHVFYSQKFSDSILILLVSCNVAWSVRLHQRNLRKRFFHHWNVFVRWFFWNWGVVTNTQCGMNAFKVDNLSTLPISVQRLVHRNFWLLSGLQPMCKDQICCAVDLHIQKRFGMMEACCALRAFPHELLSIFVDCNDNTNNLFKLPIAFLRLFSESLVSHVKTKANVNSSVSN